MAPALLGLGERVGNASKRLIATELQGAALALCWDARQPEFGLATVGSFWELRSWARLGS